MAAPWDLSIEQGADFVQTFAWSSQEGIRRSFDAYHPRAHIRTRPGGPLLLDLTPYLTVVEGVLLDDGNSGQGLRLRIPGGVTEGLTRGGSWDLLLVNKGDPDTREYLLYGKVTLRKAVTTDG